MASSAEHSSGPEDPVDGLGFAYAARLQFDDILEQLVSSAREVQASQGRLRGLLRAYLAVARADRLDDVLRHIVEAARTLVEARYAALGVIAQGGLVRFIHTGMDDATVRRIGRLPEGKGLLGLLVEHPEPLRLDAITEHVASVGFPPEHPPMRSFLGVPIRVGDRVFGNLYLTEKQGPAGFTADDEELVLALAAAAGVAVENATLLAAGRRRQSWQKAMVEATTALLDDADADAVVGRFVRGAAAIMAGVGAVAATPTDDPGRLRVTATDGVFTAWHGADLTVAQSILADAIDRGGTATAPVPRLPSGAAALPPVNVGQSIAAPIVAEDRLVAVLLVGRAPDDAPFDELDHDIMAGIAAQAGLVLQLAQVRQDNERLRLVEDRERIAEELRDRIIPRLFRHGLAVQALVERIRSPGVGERLQAQADEVDAIIRDLRDTVLPRDPAAPTPEDGG